MTDNRTILSRLRGKHAPELAPPHTAPSPPLAHNSHLRGAVTAEHKLRAVAPSVREHATAITRACGRVCSRPPAAGAADREARQPPVIPGGSIAQPLRRGTRTLGREATALPVLEGARERLGVRPPQRREILGREPQKGFLRDKGEVSVWPRHFFLLWVKAALCQWCMAEFFLRGKVRIRGE